MNSLKTIGRVSLSILALTIISHAESLAFFGLASEKSSAKTTELLMPLLPSGLGEVQFGDAPAKVLEKRQGAETEKLINNGFLVDETVPNDKRITVGFNFHNVRYGYDEGKGAGGPGLDSIRLAGYYDDKTGKFGKTRDLISACFLALGTPSQVISVDVYGGDKVPALFIYWDSGKCPVWLRIAGSVSSDRMNLFLVAELPRSNVRLGPRPEGRKIDRPSAVDFKRVYDQWLIDGLKGRIK